MKLLDYGLGEVLDRLSILALKISHAADLGKPVDHFTRERSKLLVQATTRVTGKVFECYAELAVVNARIWQGEDSLRGLRKIAGVSLSLSADEAQAALATAFELQHLNDRRAALIGEINRAAGDDVGGEEKVHVDG
jgi:hypothetical protein